MQVVKRLRRKKAEWNCICKCYDATKTRERFDIWINKHNGSYGEGMLKALNEDTGEYLVLDLYGVCPVCGRIWEYGEPETLTNGMKRI